MSVQQLSAHARRAQDIAFTLDVAKTTGDLQGIGKYLPESASTALCKISDHTRIVCGHHGTRILKVAYQGPCPCTLWCEECARSKRTIVRRSSEISEGRWPRGAEDPYVCGACEAPMPCGLDFEPLQVDTVTRMANGVKDVLGEVHLLLVESESQDPVEGIGVDAANAERARRNQDETPKKKKRDLEWFRKRAQEELGDDASEEDVDARAEEDFAAHEEKKAETRAKTLAKKRALERVGQLEEQLRDTVAKLARSERLLRAALEKGHEKQAWDREEIKEELEAEDDLYAERDLTMEDLEGTVA